MLVSSDEGLVMMSGRKGMLTSGGNDQWERRKRPARTNLDEGLAKRMGAMEVVSMRGGNDTTAVVVVSPHQLNGTIRCSD